MKIIMIVLTAFLFSCLFFCYGKNESAYVLKPADTTRVIKAFISSPRREIMFDMVFRVTKDSFDYIDADSLTKKKKFFRDTTYYVFRVDSTKKDSAGHLAKTGLYWPALKGTVYPGENLDSAFAILARWMKENPQYFPKDTTIKK